MMKWLILLLLSFQAQAVVTSSLTPTMTQATWDTAYFTGINNVTASSCSPTGTATNNTTCAEYFAWEQDLWMKGYLSMALYTGDTKYIDKAKTVIDFELTKRSTDAACSTTCGWGYEINNSQYFLDTAVITQHIALYAYVVWKDSRFSAYRTDANTYLATIELIIHSFDANWVTNSPVLGASFYRYATCVDGRQLCGTGSLMMYNQGAMMAKAGMIVYRTYQLRGLTPDAGYLDKITKVAEYYILFRQLYDCHCEWNYEGGRTDGALTSEDINHGKLDVGTLLWARGLGGITDAELTALSNTLSKQFLAKVIGSYDLPWRVNGTGTIPNSAYRNAIAVEWGELAAYNPLLMDQIIAYANANLVGANTLYGAAGWADIFRIKAGIEILP